VSRFSMALIGLLVVLLGSPLLVASHSALVSGTGLVWASPEAEEYTYYGWVPSRMYRNLTRQTPGYALPPGRDWVISSDSVRDRALLAIVGGYDDTAVAVYQLPTQRLVKEFTVNRFEKAEVRLPNGTFFKVVSTRPAVVMLLGGIGLDGAGPSQEGGSDQPGISTFLTSLDGSYVGREFIFMAVEINFSGFLTTAFPQRVFALEESQVTIWDAEARKVTEFKLPLNGVKELSLPAFRVYRLESTGHVMLQTFHIGERAARTCAYPTPTGGFLGTTFYGSGAPLGLYVQGWLNYLGERAFLVTTTEDTSLTLIDLPHRKVLFTEAVTAGNKSFQIDASQAVIQVGNPSLLMFKSGDVEGGLTFTGLRGGQTAQLLMPRGESYLFTAEETDVTVDDVRLSLRADSVLPLTLGLRRISASKNVVIEVMNLDPDQGLGMFGACIPSTQSLGLTSEGLKLKPVIEEQTPILYYALALIPILAVAAALALRKRRRPPLPAQRL